MTEKDLILPNIFTMLFVVPPKREMSNIIMDILVKKSYFSEMWYFSPTCEASPVLEKIENLTIISDPSDLSNLTFLIKNIQKYNKDKVLIVLDNCISFFTEELAILCTKCRRLGISIIITSEHLRKIPLLCRSCCNAVIFDINDPKELLKIEEEFGCHYSDNFMQLISKAIQEQYNFCYINRDTKILYFQK